MAKSISLPPLLRVLLTAEKDGGPQSRDGQVSQPLDYKTDESLHREITVYE